MNRNRTAGHNYERSIVRELKELGYKGVKSSRSESRNMDNSGVDIFDVTGALPIYIQCKSSITRPNYGLLLNNPDTPVDRPLVLFHKYTHRTDKRFCSTGEYVIIKKKDFLKLFKFL
jgi:hypothetical protein